MAIGMTAEEYWEGDPHLAPFYYKAYKLKFEMQNQMAWLQGLYHYNAVSTAIANAFSKRTHRYMDKPIDFSTRTEQEVTDEMAEKERAKAIDAFKAMRKKWETEHNGNTGT